MNFAAEGDSPIPAADRQALRDNLLEGLIRHISCTESLLTKPDQWQQCVLNENSAYFVYVLL